MEGFSVRASCRVAVRSGEDVSVAVDNFGPAGRFSAVLEVPAAEISARSEADAPAMGSAEFEFTLPRSWSGAPAEFRAVVTVTAEGSGASVSQELRIPHVPEGWFNGLSPELPGELCRYAAGLGTPAGMAEEKDDIASAYATLAQLKPEDAPAGRFFKVAPPEEMERTGCCTEAEAAVWYMARMSASGYGCCLVRLGSECHVGVSQEGGKVSKSGPYAFVRPFDACRGVPLEESLERSGSRLGSVLPSEGSADFAVIEPAWLM